MTDLESAIARMRERGQQLVADRDEQARRNRERAPEFAAWVDEYRRVFGDVKVRRFKVL